jgi:aconitate hydratase 2/2-methylisocitrate dehydratase
MGAGAKVFLASAELAAVCSSLGRIPTLEEYMSSVKALEKDASDTYRYLNFDQIPEYVQRAERVALNGTA